MKKVCLCLSLLFILVFMVACSDHTLEFSDEPITIAIDSDLSGAVEAYILRYETLNKKKLTIDTSAVDTHKVGEYKVVVTYYDTPYQTVLHVIDCIAPNVTLTADVFYIEVHEALTSDMILSSVEDHSDIVAMMFFGAQQATTTEDGVIVLQYDEEGAHTSTVVVMDAFQNITEKEFIVHVSRAIEKPQPPKKDAKVPAKNKTAGGGAKSGGTKPSEKEAVPSDRVDSEGYRYPSFIDGLTEGDSWQVTIDSSGEIEPGGNTWESGVLVIP